MKISFYFACLYILLFICTNLVFGCKSVNSHDALNQEECEERTFSYEDFEEPKRLIGRIVADTLQLEKATKLYLVNGRYLLFNGISSGFHGHLYDLQDGKVFHIGKDGGGDGDLVNFGSADFVASDQVVWIFDVVQQRWKGFALDSVLSGKRGFLRSVSFEQPAVFYPQWIDEDQIAHLVLKNNQGRFFFADRQGRLKHAAGMMPKKKNRETPDVVHVEAHQGSLYTSTMRDKLIFTANYASIFEIYNIKDKSHLRLRGPDQFDVLGSVVSVGNERHFAMLDQTRRGFADAMGTSQHIYLLFSGRSEAMAPKNEPEPGYWCASGHQVLVFDKTGVPLVYFDLDRPLLDMAIDTSKNILYGLDRVNKQIVAYDLPLDD